MGKRNNSYPCILYQQKYFWYTSIMTQNKNIIHNFKNNFLY